MKWATTPAASRTDLTYEIAYNPDFVPVRSPDASVRIVTEGGRTTPLMFNFKTGLFYELDETSRTIWELVDGKRTVKEIQLQAHASLKPDKPDEIIPSLLFFAEAGMLNSVEDKVERKRVRVVSSFITEVTLIRDASRLFRTLHRVVHPVLQSFMIWVSIGVVLAAAFVYAPHFVSIFGDAHNFQILGSSVVGFLFYNYVILGPVIVVHELSHGLALVHYTGKAGEVGTGLFYFGPMFYVDIAGYWSLPRRQRILIMWAGNLSTLLIGSSIVLIGLLLPYPPGVGRFLDLVAFWCFYLTLWNLAPPFETDGYHILSDLAGEPNLRSDAFSHVKSIILKPFRGAEKEEKAAQPANTRVLVPYAIFAIGFLGFIAFQTLRFTLYMASDTASWTGQMVTSVLPGHAITPLAYAVGGATIGYFALTISGYGVLLENQVKKLFARGLKFEALHDRDFSVFFLVPGPLPANSVGKLEAKTRSVASAITSNQSVGHQGPLFYATLRIGGTKLPVSQIRNSLRKVERGFFQIHQKLITDRVSDHITKLLQFQGPSGSLEKLLFDMAGKTDLGDRSQVKVALREFLEHQKQTIRYLVTSTFSTVWTIEVPPAGFYELLTELLPGLLVEDLLMTDLPGETEEFKKQIVYGLDSIADLAVKTAEERERAFAHPEKHQLVASFEPVRGRLILVGRTEWVEGHLTEFGSIFSIQAWSGYVDTLLADTALQLNAIAQSFPTISNLEELKDGEVRALQSYVSCLTQLDEFLGESLSESHDTIRGALSSLKGVKTLFRSGQTGAKPLDSILDLNIENLQSIPNGLREIDDMSKDLFSKTQAMKEPLEAEHEKREKEYFAKRRNVVRSYLVAGPVSLALVALGLFQPVQLASSLFGGAAAILAIYSGWYYQVWVSAHRVPGHPSSSFVVLLGSLYALARTSGGLVIGLKALSLHDVLKGQKEEERKRGVQTVDAA